MQNYLNHIFADAPTAPPDADDLLFEVQDLLRHAESPMDILHEINKITCPYYRKAMATVVKYQWHKMEQNGIEPAVYIDLDGQWRITWINCDYDIRSIIKHANAQQVELEQNQLKDNTLQVINTNTNTNLTNTTNNMPLIIQKQEGNITNNQYENCVFYCGSTPQDVLTPTTVTANSEEITPSTEPQSSSDLDKFRSLLTVPYLNRKRECDAMLELITRDGYSKKDRARMALELYQSGNVALQREHITTFRQWWRICCELLHWEGADTCYRTVELTPNDLSKQIRLYM